MLLNYHISHYTALSIALSFY